MTVLSAQQRATLPLDSALSALSSASIAPEYLRALKLLRNALVGNRLRKLAFCANTEALLRIGKLVEYGEWEDPSSFRVQLEVQIEAVTVFGIAATPDKAALVNLLSAGVPSVLWTRLQHHSSISSGTSLCRLPLILALVKSLKSIHFCVNSQTGPRVWGVSMLDPPGKTDPQASTSKTTMDLDSGPNLQLLAREAVDLALQPASLGPLLAILNLIQSAHTELQEVQHVYLELATIVASFLSATVRTPLQQRKINTYQTTSKTTPSPFLKSLLYLLDYASTTTSYRGTRLCEAACQAITALVTADGEVASRVQTALSDSKSLMIDTICNMARSEDAALSLAASCCVTTLFKAIATEPEPLVLHLFRAEQIKTILGILLRLLQSDEGIATLSAYNIAYLVLNDEELQEVACDMGALPMLQSQLKKSLKVDEDMYPSQEQIASAGSLRESVLLAVASLSLIQERVRKQVVDADLLPLIVQCLSDTSSNVRAAACQCARALSRSLNVLRTHLVDAGAAGPLLDLLKEDQDVGIQSTAAATCANLLIEYSPMKEALISRNALPRIVQLVQSTNSSLRVHALFAIKNLTCWSSSSLKELVISYLTYDGLLSMIQHSDEETQTQALGILRNIASTKESDIDAAVDGIGEAKLMQLMEDKLCSPFDEVVFQTLFIVTNSAGSKRCHDLILSRAGITRALLSHLSHSRSDIRVAAVRATKNLAAREPSQKYYVVTNDNALRLRSLGFESQLRTLREDPQLEVREYVRLTLELFAQSDFRSNP